MPTSLGESSWDALSELDESGTLAIPSLAGRELWLDVDLGAAGPGEHRIPVRLQALNGATGIGFWCYNQGGDPWGRIDMEYMLVYPGRTKPVPSRRWEAVREGIEDCRILAALRQRLTANGGAKLSEAARARIKHLLKVSLPGLGGPEFRRTDARSEPGRDRRGQQRRDCYRIPP